MCKNYNHCLLPRKLNLASAKNKCFDLLTYDHTKPAKIRATS